jgi:integrase
MQQEKVLDLSQYRDIDKKPKKKTRGRPRKKGSVLSRGGVLWVDFRYMNERVRESSGLKDTPLNRKLVRKQLDMVTAEISNGVFTFADRFPGSSKKAHFADLEGREIKVTPGEVNFRKYAERWWTEMTPGMTDTQIRDYKSILSYHLYPYFSGMSMGEINLVSMKRFVAFLKGKRNKKGKPLSGQRIQNIIIPLRVIVRDAMCEYEWHDFPDPFVRLKLPRVIRKRIYPFNFKEWQVLMGYMLPWYLSYFDFAVQTGLRPSEQVALKWSDIDGNFFHVERSRVRNREKVELKTEYSRRIIELRPSLKKALENQWELTKDFQSEYMFINSEGRPILQDKLREVWARSMARSGLRYRRMYEVRHTFASWALGAGELPEWVARTLGHANTSMVYKTYGRYIKNLTRQDGTAFERLYADSTNKKSNADCDHFGHNFGHNDQN